jgi:cytohesin
MTWNTPGGNPMQRPRIIIGAFLALVLGSVLAGSFFTRRHLLESLMLSAMDREDAGMMRSLARMWPYPVNTRGRDRRTPLHLAALHEDKALAQVLLARGASVNARDIHGRTPLHEVAREGRQDLAELLVASGADADAADAAGLTPLYDATDRGWKEVVAVLVNSLADPESRRERASTLLHVAALHGDREVADVLIAAGADMNRRHGSGSTALHSAACSAHPEMAELLIARGAEVDARDERGWTPLHCAMHPDDNEFAALVAEFFKTTDRRLRGRLIEDITPTPADRRKLVRLLVARGADVHPKADDGWTALHGAAWRGWKDIAELLLTSGAEVNARSADGKTPLKVARERLSQGDPNAEIRETIQALLAHGAVE